MMDLSPDMKQELSRRLTQLAAANEKDPAHEPLPALDRVIFGVLFFGSFAVILYKIAGF
jgi:hypothetical protein